MGYGNIYEIITQINRRHDWRMLKPTLGRGGRTLPKAADMLIWSLEQAKQTRPSDLEQFLTQGMEHSIKVTRLAKQVNNTMPYAAASLVHKGLELAQRPLEEAKVVIAGLACKQGTYSGANSPQIPLIAALLGDLTDLDTIPPAAREPFKGFIESNANYMQGW